MLELKNICFKRDEQVILDNINLVIDNNDFVAITGPNGSGKSTLAKIIMGLIKPDSGSIILDGVDITDKSIDKRANMGIAFAFQQPVRFKGITVYDLLKYASNVDKKTIIETLNMVGLSEEYLKRELNESLSGGELKRIEIASVVLRNSKLTIFDEPEAGIDLWSFNNLINVFKDIRKNVEGTNLVITHQERILNIAEKIILLKDGKVEFYGQKANILSRLYEGEI